MKIKYEVREMTGMCGLRFDDLKEAFQLAKEMAAQAGPVFLRKMTWTNKGIKDETCIVKADGSYSYI